MVAAKRPVCLLHSQRARALPVQRLLPLVENPLPLIFKYVDYINFPLSTVVDKVLRGLNARKLGLIISNHMNSSEIYGEGFHVI